MDGAVPFHFCNPTRYGYMDSIIGVMSEQGCCRVGGGMDLLYLWGVSCLYVCLFKTNGYGLRGNSVV